MNARIRNSLSLFVLVAYILAGVLLEVGHRDVHNMVLHPTPVVSNHECGSTEIHTPLNKRHDCLACTHSTLRNATVTQPVSVNAASVLCLGQLLPTSKPSPLTDVIYSGKRGPPAS